MTTRILPAEEWAKLDGTPLEAVRALMSPDTNQVLVVEDVEGRIVGTWAIVILPHLEGFWVDHDHREKAAVSKNLLRGMFDHLRDHDVPQVLTHAPGPVVESFLTRLGAIALPGTAFRLPVPEEF